MTEPSRPPAASDLHPKVLAWVREHHPESLRPEDREPAPPPDQQPSPDIYWYIDEVATLKQRVDALEAERDKFRSLWRSAEREVSARPKEDTPG